jgi:putative ABC transport system ATP-binding protein
VRRQVLFADEPTGALDSTARREVLQHLTTLPALGTSVVMVTHDPTVAAAASRVLFLYDGRIVDSLQNADAREIARRLADLEAV